VGDDNNNESLAEPPCKQKTPLKVAHLQRRDSADFGPDHGPDHDET